MITISIKIKRADKEIMVRDLESIQDYPLSIDDFEKIIVYEMYLEILSKLRASKHNDKAIRLNLCQVKVFLSYLRSYSKMGRYEMANAYLLFEQIKTEIKKKIITLIS